MQALEYVTDSAAETRALALRLAAWLLPGDIIALNGELGSGKTEFVHGLAQGLEVPAEVPVASPSFTLAHEYPGRVLLVHLDLYRLEDLPAEMLPDLEEYLSGHGGGGGGMGPAPGPPAARRLSGSAARHFKRDRTPPQLRGPRPPGPGISGKA